MNILKWWVFVFGILWLASCKTYRPTTAFQNLPYSPPDYGQLSLWAAHLDKMDPADKTPEGDTIFDIQKAVDVFFLHPTTYTGENKGQNQWNAPLHDASLDRKTDEGTILFQASVFNHAGIIYAPRYRQAHLHAYFTDNKRAAKSAFDLAYEDIKNAFEYYIANKNMGRPIIIASHSQGTTHAIRLLKEYFDGKPLMNKLVAAYLIGMPVAKDQFTTIMPCKDSTDIGCFVSWRTFKTGTKVHEKDDISVTNPLTWQTNMEYAPKKLNLGTLLFDFHKIYQQHMDAQINESILWTNKPKFRGSLFLRTKNYHPADFNFFYFNIRNNAVVRVQSFLGQHH